LFGRAEGVDGVHNQRGLHADKAAKARVAAFQLLHYQAVFHVGHAGAAVALEIGAEEAQLAHHGNKFAGETALAEAVFDDGDEVVFNEIASGAADEELVLRKAGVEMEEVEVLEFEGHFRLLWSGSSKQVRLADGGAGGEGEDVGVAPELA
jgi:hypothetical protein